MSDDAAPAGTRELNRLRVLEALLGHAASSRSELARRTGLSRATVSALLDELESAGMVEQRPDERGDGDGPRPAGRPPLQVSQDWSRAEVDHAPAESLDLARELVAGVLRAAGVERAKVLGVGMGVAAPVDPASGTAYTDGILPSWDGIDPAAEMAARPKLEVQLENDANAGALGEHRFGAGRGASDMVYVRLSTGVGVGLVLDGRPYRGGAGLAGELAGAGDVLLEPLRGAIERRAVPPAAATVRVTRGALGEQAEVLGAAALPLARAPRALARRLA